MDSPDGVTECRRARWPRRLKTTWQNCMAARVLINAEHSHGAPVLRSVGPDAQVRAFPSFAMAVLAGIEGLPDTIADRADDPQSGRSAE